MPTTRKSSRISSRPNKQSTLSFNHRVTKNVPKLAKDSVTPSPDVKQYPLEDDKPRKAPVIDAGVATSTKLPSEEEEKETIEPLDRPDAEIKAATVSNSAIENYWRKLEDERLAKRVHQEDLTTSEKVLRYFDVSSQFGPCIGISRIKRWHRAERMGLNPPIEVLAVLLKEDAGGNKLAERAHLDMIMNATAIGVA